MLTQPMLSRAIATEGFAFLAAADMQPVLAKFGSLDDWPGFAASWNDLSVDSYMADGGRYRRRRHAHFAAKPAEPLRRMPHGPHYQGLEYNPLNGGIQRWFEPVTDAIGASKSLASILAACRAVFEAASPIRDWAIEIHQFRIEATQNERGQPTPEGSHRDGVDFVLVLMVNRVNIASGTTSIHAPDGRPLGAFTLTAPFDAALVDDHRVYHGVTPVEPIDALSPAFRDVLVVTFRNAAQT